MEKFDYFKTRPPLLWLLLQSVALQWQDDELLQFYPFYIEKHTHDVSNMSLYTVSS